MHKQPSSVGDSVIQQFQIDAINPRPAPWSKQIEPEAYKRAHMSHNGTFMESELEGPTSVMKPKIDKSLSTQLKKSAS